jgi:hypothetical protein
MPDAGRQNAGQNSYEELGVLLFTPEPDDFDPLRANDLELLLYGYPPRPDVQEHPELHERWNELMSRPRVVIKPEFGNPPSGSSRRPAKYGPIAEVPGWSGVIASSPGSHFKSVMGVWQVPNTAPLRSAPDVNSYESGIWVGIDGYSNTIASSLVQAGTAQQVYREFESPGDQLFFARLTYAWWEWLPDDPRTVSNLSVSPGDVFYCAVVLLSSTEAAFYMLNFTTGLYTSFRKPAPRDRQTLGQTAEWILECPHAEPAYMPKFGIVYFDLCTAYTQDQEVVAAGDAYFKELKDADGRSVASPTKVDDLLFRIYYVGDE